MSVKKNNSEIIKLQTQKATLNGQLTRFDKYLCNINLSSLNLSELATRLEKNEDILSKFEDCQLQLEILGEDDDHELEREHFENFYYMVISKARSLLNGQQIGQVNSNESQSKPVTNEPLVNIKLPPLNLPHFDGSFDKWLQFYDAFNSIIHVNTNLSPAQKFYYLLSSLQGEAKQSIQSLQVSDNNYFVAWELICDRYRNSRLIINSHLKALFAIPALVKESKDSLRQFINDLQKNIRALENLGQPVCSWDSIILFLMSSKLDDKTRREWELSLSDSKELPSYDDFIKFLSKRSQALEMIEFKSKIGSNESNHSNRKYNERSYSHLSNQGAKFCNFCKGSHLIYYCYKFLKLSINERINEIRKLQLCTKCLRSGHPNKDCKSEDCRKCKKNHNTLLHLDKMSHSESSLPADVVQQTSNDNMHQVNNFLCSNNDSQQIISASSSDVTSDSVTILANQNSNPFILLSTANVFINDANGKPVLCRALLDSGSQSNYMTYNLLKKLNLEKSKVNILASGISKNSIHIEHSSRAKVFSTYNNFQIETNFLILNKITGNLPNTSFNKEFLNIPNNIHLADSNFNVPNSIDILLGAGIFWSLLCVGQISLGKGMPVLQKSHFGWIISGSLCPLKFQTTSCHLNIEHIKIQEQLEKFWKVEECLPVSRFSKEELECERFFVDTTKRDKFGNFIVSLPTRENIQDLGQSKDFAFKRLIGIEKRLSNNENLRRHYHDFMQEYIDMGHMSLVESDEDEASSSRICYLPHHPVLKVSSLTTKCRVVFDASAKTTSNLSLNDVLKVGPKIQDDLFSIIVRFRCHNFVFIGDIEKMYRMVQVYQPDRDLQRILWRFDINDEVESYRLNTVTYGTGPASFLAVRCLHEVAYENMEKYPEECHIILKDFYVDDLISGAATIEEAFKLRNNISNLLAKSGFLLRKWASNNKNILKSETSQLNTSHYSISDDKDIKALGVFWSPSDDTLKYSTNFNTNLKGRITKRFILSIISQIFDPLGLLAPVNMRAKLILQKLWREKIDWDQTVPQDLFSAFTHFYNQISDINDIIVPRHVSMVNAKTLTIHGFCDASITAYGACLYVVSHGPESVHSSQLLCAKSRIAPLKTLTLPRLELSGALLLANLFEKVRDSLSVPVTETYLWTDSTIVLSWLAMEPSDLKTFVSNRVSSIQSLTSSCHWKHVPSQDNPADLISRGLSPRNLLVSSIWWSGPDWLVKDDSSWPTSKFEMADVPERRENKTVIFTSTFNDFNLLKRYSSFLKLLRVTAYTLRFIHNVRNPDNRFKGSLSVSELEKTLNVLIGIAQRQDFSSDIESLNKLKTVSHKSKILSLDPFLDESLIRVGGRLRHSNLSFEQKHPLLLSDKNHLTKLLVKYEHEKMLHAGAQTVLCNLRSRFWPLNGRSLVRGIIRRCVVCFKAKPRGVCPKMGDLPSARVSYSPPFTKTGLDFAGPLMLKDGKARNRTSVKAYVCVFICFTTKAVHLELVGDLSSQTFLDALKRFVARRGLPSDIYSDNATNFVGAAASLREIYRIANDFSKVDIVKDFLVGNGIQWHFIPPRSPHFGGLWEACVKSCKFHLKRIVGNAHITFEQLYTVLVQIEAIQNSRPLIPLSSDPNDLEPLTPAHFLIGRLLTGLPQRYLEDTPTNRLRHYERMQQLAQHYWRRWHEEYLNTLQTRLKWKRPGVALKPGMMVLVKDEQLPPFEWPLGRIIEVHPGPDQAVRVVTVKTARGIVKRSFSKICPLPEDEELKFVHEVSRGAACSVAKEEEKKRVTAEEQVDVNLTKQK